MGEGKAFSRPVPMLLSRRNKDNISGADRNFLIFSGYDSFAFGNNKYLFNGMSMKLVSNAFFKIDLLNLKSLTFRAYNRLHGHRSSKQRVLHRLFGHLVNLSYLH